MMFRLVVLCTLVALSMGGVQKGRRTMRPMLDGRIVGGDDTTIEENPHQVSLQSYGSHNCGGSIVSTTRIVTAAHCTDGASISSSTVRVGTTYRGQGGQVHDIITIHQHPDFSYWSLDYDVSVLVVPEITFGAGAQPIALQGLGEVVADGAPAIVSGWGTLASGGPLPTVLQRVTVHKVNHNTCKKAYDELSAQMTCYGSEQGDKDSCQGDSGGPLIHDGKLVGIVSFGRGCAEIGYPGVYTDVSSSSVNNHITEYL